MKNIRGFYPNLFQFLEVKCSIYLNRRVFVMCRGYSLEAPWGGPSYVPTTYVFMQKKRNFTCFISCLELSKHIYAV